MKRLVVATLVGGVVVVSAAGIAYAQSPRTTASGTRIAGVPIAPGLTQKALEQRLQLLIEAQPSSLHLIAGTRTVDLVRKDLGVAVDVTATAKRTLATSGRRRLLGLIGFGSGHEVEPRLSVDALRLSSTVLKVVTTSKVDVFHGDLTWQGSRYVVKPPTNGQSATAGDVRSALQAAVRHLSTSTDADGTDAEVAVTQQPAEATQADLDALAAQAQAGLQPIRLVAADLTTTVSVADFAPLVTVTATTPLALALRTDLTKTLATRVAANLSSAAREPRFTTPPSAVLLTEQGNTRWSPRPATVPTSVPGHIGHTVGVASVTAALTTALREPQPQMTLEADIVPPAVSPALAGRVNALIGTFTTYYGCCQPRVRNIQLIARTIDGTVIAPGESFSLNGIVGRRTLAKGYVEAPYILNGKLELDVGGGISQFATTMYNAAFFGGLQLDRHQAHSFYISRYPVGREATVNFPDINLAWTNNTGVPVVIDTATTGTSLTVSLYGDNGGRTVSASTGERLPVPGKDFRITVTRTLTGPEGKSTTEKTTTTYDKPPAGE